MNNFLNFDLNAAGFGTVKISQPKIHRGPRGAAALDAGFLVCTPTPGVFRLSNGASNKLKLEEKDTVLLHRIDSRFVSAFDFRTVENVVYVINKIAHTKSDDGTLDSLGAVTAPVGISATTARFSAAGPYRELGGSDTEVVSYSLGTVVYGIAKIGDQFITVTDNTPNELTVDAVLVYNAAALDAKEAWGAVPTVAEAKEAGAPMWTVCDPQTRAINKRNRNSANIEDGDDDGIDDLDDNANIVDFEEADFND